MSLDGVVDHPLDLVVQVGAREHLATLVVDDGALAVQDLVVLQDVLADLEVLRLDGWAERIARDTILDSIGTSTGMLRRSMIISTAPALNRRIRSSPSDR